MRLYCTVQYSTVQYSTVQNRTMHYPLRPLEPKVSTGHYREQYLPIPWAPQVSKVQQSTVHYPPGPWEPKSLQQSTLGKTQVSTVKPSSESTWEKKLDTCSLAVN